MDGRLTYRSFGPGKIGESLPFELGIDGFVDRWIGWENVLDLVLLLIEIVGNCIF